jgi:ABC-type transport system involved in multi-copper enzyme maturation permease subunit
MNVRARRVRAIFRKELQEFRRRPSIIFAMSAIPVIFLVEPLVVVFGLNASAVGPIGHEHLLLYLLGIPALTPVLIAAYAVVGEREQGTLEPMLTTPIRRNEFVLAKALASLLPSVVVAYLVFAGFVACVALFANPAVASAVLQWPQILAQILFTPLIAAWTIWIGMFISAKSNDIRVSQQLGTLATLPTVVVIALVAFNIIPATPTLAACSAAVLVLFDLLGWGAVSVAFNRERLVIGTR